MQKEMVDAEKCDVRVIHFDKVKTAQEGALTEDDLLNLTGFFKTFADPNRLKILMALDMQEMCVCDIAAFLNVSESAVSHQLRYLRNAKLVKSRREGTILYYRLVDEHVMKTIVTGLEHVRE